MALTPEVLKANESLAGLSEDQLSTIATLSSNDENTVIGTKIGEVHGKYEQDVFAVAGIEKKQGEKAYDYTKRVLGDFKTKAESSKEVQANYDKALQDIADLNSKIEAGKGNEVTAQQLKDANQRLNDLDKQYNTDKAAWAEKEKGFATEMTSYKVNSEFSKVLGGLKFKAEYGDNIQKILIKNAQDTILGQYTPEWQEVQGVNRMVFRDKDGNLLNNKANGLNPYTAEELIKEALGEVLDAGKVSKGGGSANPDGSPAKVDLIEVSQATTQVEADEIISKYLMQKGITRGSEEFAAEQTKLRNDNGVAKLPIQ